MNKIQAITALFICLIISSCSPGDGGASYPETAVGLKTSIRFNTQTLEQEVSKVEGPIVTMETSWHGERLWISNLYRGLFSVSSVTPSESFDMEFDYDVLDEIFPLAVGKVISFPARTQFIHDGTTADTLIHMAVTQRRTASIGDENLTIFVVEKISEFRDEKQGWLTHETLHYSPKYGIIVKRVLQREGESSIYWNVTEIFDDKEPKTQHRRNGTLLI